MLDTSAYSALMRGVSSAIEQVKTASCIYMSPIVLGELRQGFFEGNKQAQNEQDLASFLGEKEVLIFDVTDVISTVYAKLKSHQRKAGAILAANDLWIAATALYLGVALVTYDGDFSRIDYPGFRLVLLSDSK